jgi:uncharacterized protein (DUF3820 family)
MDGYSVIPFGKFKNKTIEDCPSSYLKWLAEQDFFEAKYLNLLKEIEQELEFRTRFDTHFEEES